MRKLMFIIVAVLGVLPLNGQQETCDCPYPIVFVHGWNGGETSFEKFSDFIQPIYGDRIEIPTLENNSGTVYYAHLNYNYSSTSLFGSNLNEDTLGYVDDDVILHDQFDNAPTLMPNKCIYAISFKTKKSNQLRQLVAEYHNEFEDIIEPLDQWASNQASAVKQGYALGKAIKKILNITGKSKVILVAHSMGGLQAREYLQRKDTIDNSHPWWVDPYATTGHKVAKLFTVGTPHRGSNRVNAAIFNLIDPIWAGWFTTLDEKSPAVRDLRFSYDHPSELSIKPGVYLYGGNENQTNNTTQTIFDKISNYDLYSEYDVNCDGDPFDSIGWTVNTFPLNQSGSPQVWHGTMENQDMPLPDDLKYTYYVSNLLTSAPGVDIYGFGGDGVVDDNRQWLYEEGDGNTSDFHSGESFPRPFDSLEYLLADRITSPKRVFHMSQTTDFTTLLRGLDEADFPKFAYEIGVDTAYAGISQKRADKVAINSNARLYGNSLKNDPNIDSDWYKVSIPAGNSEEYHLIFNKSDKRYYKIDFFAFQTPDPYSNPDDAGLDAISNLGEKKQVVLDLGLLQEGEYFFRITSDASYPGDDLASYTFRLYNPQPCINPEFGMNSKDCDPLSFIFTHNQEIEFSGEPGLAYQMDVFPDNSKSEEFVSCGAPFRVERLENNQPLLIRATNVLDNSCKDIIFIDQDINCNVLSVVCDFLDFIPGLKAAALKNLFCGDNNDCIVYSNPFLNQSTRQTANADLPSALNLQVNHLNVVVTYENSIFQKDLLYYGSLYENENIQTIKSIFDPYIDDDLIISSTDSIQYLLELDQFDIPQFKISLLINRINATKRAWDSGIVEPSIDYLNVLSQSTVDSLNNLINQSNSYYQAEGHTSIDELYQSSIDAINDYSLEDDPDENAVCASVGIKLSQTLTMTREAFEGTLTIFNGSLDGAMDSIELELIITDEFGVISNDLFQIETTGTFRLTAIDGTGMLAADTEGTATNLFIPEPGAAPTVPVPYSFGGNLSYIDPFSGTRVTLPLVPVTLTVNPSPDLFLHYFLERDVLGDDAFTAGVEPSIPARLGLMIENNGYGEARNVRIETARPQVIDNEKGLALSLNFIGSKLQGQPASMGLSNIDFGSIDPLSTKVGEWLFTSNLLGHFTGYSTNLRHSDSRGNPDLSLISGIELHELIHSINVYGELDDDIEDFLVNQVPDANDHPDAIYLTQRNIVYDVSETFSGEFIGDINYPTFTNTLSVTPVDTNWNYIELDDPGDGRFDIVSVTRDSDGFLLPSNNTWLTYVTIPDSREQVYENKFHFVDDVLATEPQTYTVVWSPKDPNPPEVDTITGQPKQLAVLPVKQLQIVFSEEIADSTFTWEDISLIRSGGANLVDASLIITKIDSVTYLVDISPLTNENGFYVFTVQTAGVRDLTGTPGMSGKQVSWTQSLNRPIIIEYTPVNNGDIESFVDNVEVLFNLSIDTFTFSMADVQFYYEDSLISKDGVTLELLSDNLKLFRFGNLPSLNNGEGLYKMVVDLPNIASTTNVFGFQKDSIQVLIDHTRPEIVSLTKMNENGFDAQHVTSIQIKLSELISPLDTQSITFLKDGFPISGATYIIQHFPDSTLLVSWFAPLTYGEGSYTFIVNESLIIDLAGIPGVGSQSIFWTVDRTPNLIFTNLDIDPDYGISAEDEITYNDVFNFTFVTNEPASEVKYYQNDNGKLTLLCQLETINSGSHSVPISLVTKGNSSLLITAKDTFGNEVNANLPINIDESPLAGNWTETQGQSLVTHPQNLHFSFLKNVLDKGIPNGALQVLLNNTSISHNLILNRISTTEYEILNFQSLPNKYGDYQIGIDLTKFHKESSGISGSGLNNFHYTIPDPNNTPIANAGPDQIIRDLGTITLDGSLSSDPDGDPFTYKWITFDDITLSNDTIVNPQFDLNISHIGKVLTFMLVVEDHSKTSTDLVRIIVALDDIYLTSRIFLQGSFDPMSGLMKDDLRSLGLIPLVSPYSDLQKFSFGNVYNVPDPQIFTISGSNAIVDWVYLELTDINTGLPIRGGSYFVQRDGDIVTTDGNSQVVFENLNPSNYNLSIYHRNHLPIITSDIVILQTNQIKNIDFTNDLSMVIGALNAMKLVNDIYTLFAGDADGNGQIQNSDIVNINAKIGLSGYLNEDINMNGQVQNEDIQLLTNPNLGKGKQFDHE